MGLEGNMQRHNIRCGVIVICRMNFPAASAATPGDTVTGDICVDLLESLRMGQESDRAFIMKFLQM